MSKGKIVLLAAQKGGPGKSTTCVCVAHAMNQYFGKKVAIVDSDEQASAMSFYSQRKITANEPELANSDMSFPEVAMISDANPYRKQIERIKEFYDVVLVDTKGEFKQFQHDLLRMADYVITPVQASEFDTVPTKLVRDAVNHENTQREDDEQILMSYIISKVNMRANSTQFTARMIREDFGCEVLEPFIPFVDIIPAASGLGLTPLDVVANPSGCRSVINKRRSDGEKLSLDREQSAEIAKIYKQLAEKILVKLELI